MIAVEVTHPDPILATIATDQILKAYIKHQDDNANSEYQVRKDDLAKIVADLRSELSSNRDTKTALDSTADLSSLAHTLSQLDDRKAIIEREDFSDRLLIIQIDSEGTESGDAGTVVPSENPADLSEEIDVFALAQNDAELRTLLARRQDSVTSVAISADRLSADHPERKRKEAQMRVLSDLVDDRVAILVARNPAILFEQTGPMSKERILAQIADRDVLLKSLQEERGALVVARDRLHRLEENIAEIKFRLDSANTRMEKLEVERSSLKDEENVGRAFIAQQATTPFDPSTDRRISLTVAGTLFGGGLGMGLISLLGLMRGGLRYIDEFESPAVRAPLLGCLPDLESDDERASDMAALSVHHIRSMLEVRHGDPDTSRTLLITSPSTGDGKTSLALSLASSFAIAGHKTVIVDGDLIGRGLTRELGLELEPGLVDALKSGSINGEIHATATPNLCAVPAGEASLCTPEHLSTDSLRSLLAGLRETYEYVLVDSGPVLGSIEANVFAPLSDQTILVVGRGQSNRVVKASLERLDRLNAKCCGVVFNRADIADFSRSVSTASLSVGSSVPSSSRKKSGRGDHKSLVSNSHKNKRDM